MISISCHMSGNVLGSFSLRLVDPFSKSRGWHDFAATRLHVGKAIILFKYDRNVASDFATTSLGDDPLRKRLQEMTQRRVCRCRRVQGDAVI